MSTKEKKYIEKDTKFFQHDKKCKKRKGRAIPSIFYKGKAGDIYTEEGGFPFLGAFLVYFLMKYKKYYARAKKLSSNAVHL